VSVGRHLRRIRQGRGLSLRSLAAATGLTASFLSQVERDLAVPSIASLRTVARVLDVPVFTFFLGEGEQESTVIVHPEDRRVMAAPHSGQLYELLNPVPTKRIQMMLVHLEPGADTASRGEMHEGEEGVYVLAGEAEFTLNGDVHRLGAGDSAYYPALTPHRFRNCGQGRLILFFCMTPPA
jgi:quercetin dioxygenase-like cupin family protein